MQSDLGENMVDRAISVNYAGGCQNEPYLAELNNSMTNFNFVCPISTIALSGSTYTITLKDARTFAITFDGNTPPNFMVGSSSYWSQQEFTLLRAFLLAMLNMTLIAGMTDLEVTYN